jgi:hypothetical protein
MGTATTAAKRKGHPYWKTLETAITAFVSVGS